MKTQLKTQYKYISNCCEAKVEFEGNDDGIDFYWCNQCFERCDKVLNPKWKQLMKKEKKLGKPTELSKEQKLIQILTWLYTFDGSYNSRYEWRLALIDLLKEVI